jgi:WD40 repeat protein/DNA-binding SARP family transcriptional activator
VALSLFLFGGFRASMHGAPITLFESSKVRGLLAYLAVEAVRLHQRSTLAGLFWPDHPEDLARTNLRHVMRQLRQLLPSSLNEPPVLLANQQTVQLNPAYEISIDVIRFRELLADCERCEHKEWEDCAACIERATEAAALYQGAFLADLSIPDSDLFEEWRAVQRELLHRQALELFFSLSTYHEERNEWEQARHYAARQLELEPWREEAHRQMMRLLARSGQRTAALAQYAQCRTVLRQELGIEPDAETVALYEQIRTSTLDRSIRLSAPPVATPSEPLDLPQQDWGEAPAPSHFYGRETELAQLKQWLLGESGAVRAQLVVVLGMGGMGKTTLVARAARELMSDFELVFWRSLLNAPPPTELLREALGFLSLQQLTRVPASLSDQLTLLLGYLRQHRCLLVLDNVESILEAGQAGHYRPGYEGYAQLLDRVAQGEHRSALVLTSREYPHGVWRLEDDLPSVQVLLLDGLEPDAGQTLLQARGLGEDKTLAATVVQRYSGNPLALKLVARTIEELFDGDIAAFLSDESLIFDDIRNVLDQQFRRLSALEREILLWLAVEREGITLTALMQNLVHPPTRRELLEALQALQRRSLLEKNEAGFTLQNVVTEYLTDALIDQICREILEFADGAAQADGQTLQSKALNRHALLKAQAKEYVRQSQVRLILAPIAKRLVMKLGESALITRLKRIVSAVQTEAQGQALAAPGYAGGNILNLLLYLGVDSDGLDFSNICVWQAYLRGVYAPQLNLGGADLEGSAFTYIFGHVQGLQFRQANELLVFGSSDGMARVWRASDGGLLHTLPLQSAVHTFVQLHSDSRIGILGGDDYALIVVDFAEARVVQRLVGHQSPVLHVAFGQGAAGLLPALASGDASGTICVWEAGSGRLLHRWQGHPAPISALAFDPAGELLASADVDGTLCLWQLPSGKLLSTWQAHQEEVAALCFTLFGAWLATASHDHTVGLWDIRDPLRAGAEGKAAARVLRRHTQHVRLLATDPSGQLLSTGGGDKFILVWDVQTGQVRQLLADHNSPILYLAFSEDGRLVAALDFNETIHVWDVRTGQRVDFYRIHHSAVQAVAFSPDGKRLISGGADWALYLWEITTPTESQLSARLQGHQQRIESLDFGVDGVTVASGDLAGEIRLWNLRRRSCRALRGHEGAVRALAFSPDGERLASASADGTLCVWDIQHDLRLLTLRGHTNLVSTCAFSPDGRWVASGSMDRTILIWDAKTGELLQTLRGHTNMVQQVRFCLDGRRLLSSSFDNTLALWDVTTGQLLQSWPTQGTTSLAIHPDGKTLIAGGRDHVTRLIELDTGRVIGELHGHLRTVESVSLSPDGRWLVTAGHDETIKLWDLAAASAAPSPEACLVTLRAPGPYAGMVITNVTGITQAQKAALQALGAVSEPDPWSQRATPGISESRRVPNSISTAA